jgi:hypothetical protein
MPKKKKVSLQIAGKTWTIEFGNPGSTNGVLDDAVCIYEDRRIVVRRKAKGSLLNCISHEIIHARCPDLEEGAVHDCGDLIDEAMIKVLENLLH